MFVGNSAFTDSGSHSTWGGGSHSTWGGGLYNSGSPTLNHCSFINNTSWNSTNFNANYGGGMCSDSTGHVVLNDCRFIDNEATQLGGGGLWLYRGSSTLTNCVFIRNINILGEGGGLTISYYSNATLSNCTFIDNWAYQGGGLLNAGGDPTMVNCTFTGNAGADGCAIFNHDGFITMSNSILWNNRDSQIDMREGGTAQITYSCIQGGWPGLGNIDTDPMFASVVTDNAQLKLGSPCIDAGNNADVPIDILTDLYGNNRFVDDPAIPDTGSGTPPIVDMGAYEYDPIGDDDDDGILNATDNCQVAANPDQANTDSDTFGDVCDNCPDVSNADQADADDDSVGDLCDNCPDAYNEDQADFDGDGIGDVCDDDYDGDGTTDDLDNCPEIYNPDQADSDLDAIGDACDACPDTAYGLPVDEQGCPPPSDFDDDGDVDLQDFGHLQACLGEPDDPTCQDTQLDDNSTIDVQDLSIFLNCMSGSQMSAVDPNCTH